MSESEREREPEPERNLSGWIGWGIFLLLVGGIILARLFGVSC